MATALWALTAFSGCVIVSGNMNPFSSAPQPLEEHVVGGEGRERVVLLDISGAITNQARTTTLGLRTRESTVAQLAAGLEKAKEDDRVRALVLRVNSPGGSVTASDVLYNMIRRFREESGVPVVATVTDVGASGAYYAALAADEILAHPTSVVGSIGVIFQSVSLAGLLDKVGVRNQSVATGSKKELGSPLKNMSADERAIVQGVIDDLQERFVSLVRQHRNSLTPAMDRQMRDGRIFSADQALQGGLVDGVGYVEDAIERARDLAGISQSTVVLYRQSNEYARSLHSRGGEAPQVSLIHIDMPSSAAPRFLYQWIPGNR